MPKHNSVIFCMHTEKIKDWSKMHQTLFMRKSFPEKPDADECSLEELHKWHKEKCLLVHKNLLVF